jgi:hypothetical protein
MERVLKYKNALTVAGGLPTGGIRLAETQGKPQGNKNARKKRRMLMARKTMCVLGLGGGSMADLFGSRLL